MMQEIIDNTPAMSYPHAQDLPALQKMLATDLSGLSCEEARRRLEQGGENRLPSAAAPTLAAVFLRQFFNPLIYILLAAAIISFSLGEIKDGAFILIVLLLNAVIGTTQEYRAEKSALALQSLSSPRATVRRDSEDLEIDSRELVQGDLVLLQPGVKVPADLRLVEAASLQIDESLLTGESLATRKDSDALLGENCALGDRLNMAFAGTLVQRGRGLGLVTATGADTELGKIATSVMSGPDSRTPLILRMEKFTRLLSLWLVVLVLGLGGIYLWQGNDLVETLLLSVALAVSAIPEGLPVAMTVALAVASSRMSKRNVIVRKLPAVEALGSCTFIATDKTGTLTVNEMTVTSLALPGEETLELSGNGILPEGVLSLRGEPVTGWVADAANALAEAATRCNEGFFGKKENQWVHHGDAMDVALLVMGHKLGVTRAHLEQHFKALAEIPYESEIGYAASLDQQLTDGEKIISIKGALEKLLPMCSNMRSSDGQKEIDPAMLEKQAQGMAEKGQRVLAVAAGPTGKDLASLAPENLTGLTFLGLVGFIDPLRPEAALAYQQCRKAGIKVAMITGDHPLTAVAVARALDMDASPDNVVTGAQLEAAATGADFDSLVEGTMVFARVEPHHKLKIVESLMAKGHFVAVTGDGANDAPALKASHVGVAMGKAGTDVAREVSDLILTDDRFASIVAGIEEGRVAYANLRKVIYLLISTGAAEIILFALSILAGLPAPLTAVQLLWLNLVTNGIQDVALAFEPTEGDELSRKPRSPSEAVFNKLMLWQVGISATVIGVVAFLYYWYVSNLGWSVPEMQNSVLLLMVLFENVMIGNVRSETHSSLTLSPFRNPLLLFGALAAQGIHLLAMQFEGLGSILGVAPVEVSQWAWLLLLACSVFVVIEIFKLVWRRSHV